MSLTVTHGSNSLGSGATTADFMTYNYIFNSGSSNRRIDLDPTLNNEIGDYTVNMRLTLDDYTSIFTDFSFVVTVNPCQIT